MFDDIDNQIKSAKDILKKKSKDYIQNFNNIKSYIDIEIQQIKRSKDLNQPIIPELNFDCITDLKSFIQRRLIQCMEKILLYKNILRIKKKDIM